MKKSVERERLVRRKDLEKIFVVFGGKKTKLKETRNHFVKNEKSVSKL